MHRPIPLRTLRLVALSVLVSGLAFGPPASAKGATPKRPPNIVFFVTDDQTLGQFSEQTMPATHRLLVGKGTSFSDAIVTTPLCCPSRATMLTGQYGHNNGVLRNNYADLKRKRNVLPTWLQRAGYRTIHVGKFMNRYPASVKDPSTVAPGWDRWQTVVKPLYYDYELQVNGKTTDFGSEPEDHLTRVISERTKREIRRGTRRSQPFFAQIDHYAPHDSPQGPDRCPGGAVPEPRDIGRFSDEPLPQPPSFNEADMSDKPSFMQGLAPLDADAQANLTRLWGCTLASLRGVDRAIAGAWRELKRAGELKRTVFVFVSDNGFFFGEHRIPVSKQNPYEEGLRVPLVIRAPRKYVGGGSSKRIGKPVANIDLAPTFLDLARAEPCKKRKRCRTLDGRSLVPLLKGRKRAWPKDRSLVVELDRGKSPVSDGRACNYSGVRTKRGILIDHRGAIDPQSGRCEPLSEYELYDLKADPFQLDNLAPDAQPSTPEAAFFADLASRHDKLHNCRGIKGRDPRPPGKRSWCE